MMKHLYIAFPYTIAWTLLIVGILCLSISIQAKKAADLGFGLLGLIIIILFAIPPEGTIPAKDSSQIVTIIVKRVSIFIYYASIPWFLVSITSVDRKKLAIVTACIALALYVIMRINDVHDNGRVLSLTMRSIVVTGILVLAARAAAWNYQQKYSNNKVRIFVALLSAYQLLFLLVILANVTKISPINFFIATHSSLSVWSHIFMLTIFSMLVTTQLERSKLEKVFKISEKRLQTVMENAPMMVLELESDGSISYINDFGVILLGYTDAKDLLNVNWFNTFLLPSDIALLQKLYTQIFNGALLTATFKNTVRRKNGQEIMINWVNFMSQEQNTNVHAMICIGRDISSEETANRLVAEMQKELEKENLVMAETAHFELEENVVGKSKAFMYAVQRARQVAITHAPVLLEGETGVGKEVFANLIHMNSSRSNMPFIKVNCGALPKELIEDELFGHEKGAFTSAIQARKGRFELADNGTIFLDEIGELPPGMQPKLLRVLQNGEFERVGGQKTIKVDVRILAATNRNLLDEINHGNFREDLYYRLNVFPITIPALRNRKEDLPDLIHYFISSMSKEYKKTLEQISTADLQLLLGHRWPGNIRELKNVIERAVIVSEGRVLKLDWWHDGETTTDSTSNQALEQVERVHIITVLEQCRWKINGDNGAAEILNMHPNTLRSKMKRLRIARPLQKNPEEVESANSYIPNGAMGSPPPVSRTFSS
jgi:formate hydrogenlyase transcriptional activator